MKLFLKKITNVYYNENCMRYFYDDEKNLMDLEKYDTKKRESFSIW